VLREETDMERIVLMTDPATPYKRIGAEVGWHEQVNHTRDEYARGAVTTNSIEGYSSQLKRRLSGTYHHVSAKHLHRYLAEFDCRYNMRKAKDGERTEAAIVRAAGKRLTYKQPSQSD
jgi:hypothetical protein